MKEQDVIAHLEYAWTIIANASGGDWTKESEEWQEAAAKWRDGYHAILTQKRSEHGTFPA